MNTAWRWMTFATVLLVVGPPLADAREFGRVPVAEQVTLDDGTKLVLNGAGLRVSFVFDIYVGASYLPTTSGDAQAVLSAPRANRVLMNFVYDEVDADSLREAWSDGFNANHTEAELEALQERIDAFNALFAAVVEGDDEYTLVFAPGNGKPVGRIPGDDFNRAMLAIWLGERPADKRLKMAMLGG